jgi:hypothetical protein
MSRSHRDNQRRLDHELLREHWWGPGRDPYHGAPRYPYRRIYRYGAPVRGYWAGVKVKRRRIERTILKCDLRRKRLDDLEM